MAMSVKKSREVAKRLQKQASTVTRRSFYEIDAAFPYLSNDRPKKPFSQEHYTKLVKKLMPSIRRLIYRISGHYADQHKELMQHALMAIWETLVIDGDNRNNVAFAWHKIKNSVKRAMSNDMVRSLGRPGWEARAKYNRATNDYIKKHGREPNAEELAGYMKTNVTYVRDWLCRKDTRFIPIDVYEAPLVWGAGRKQMDFLKRAREYEDKLIYWIDRHWARKVVGRLDPHTRKSMEWFDSEMSLQEWANCKGVHRDTVLYHIRKGLWYSRLLAELNFDLNSSEDPIKFLRARGIVAMSLPTRYPRKNEELV